MKSKAILSWTLISECKVPEDITNLLIEGEKAVAAYKTFRDMAIFTNKRIIIRDSQGLSGHKIEMYTIPYKNINMWSTENAGLIDLNSEVELWTRAGHFKIKLAKSVDVRKFDQLIAEMVLNG